MGTGADIYGQQQEQKQAKREVNKASRRTWAEALTERGSPLNIAAFENFAQQFLGADKGMGAQYAQLASMSNNPIYNKIRSAMSKDDAMRTPEERFYLHQFQTGGFDAVDKAWRGGGYQGYQNSLRNAPQLSTGQQIEDAYAKPGGISSGYGFNYANVNTDVISPEQLAQIRGAGMIDANRQMENALARTGMSGSSAGLIANRQAQLANTAAANREKIQANQLNRQSLYDYQRMAQELGGLYEGFQ